MTNYEPFSWSKVAVDTKIYVRNNIEDEWLPSHFAAFADDKVYAWNDGRTSFSGKSKFGWKYASLAVEVQHDKD